ncbi:ferritin [Candidatus Woesearchaeota archaeon]|nr:ferritin [Candidatus Woesearchaeota archaeon]
MQITKKINDALNVQIQEELNSAYIYLAMQAKTETFNLPGISKWLNLQFQEEIHHAMKIFNFINERNGEAQLLPIPQPKATWKNAKEIFEAAYKHEQHITSCIHKLVDLARKEGDHATENMLQWFVSEQVEEETNTSTVLEQIKMAGDNKGALMMLDYGLGKRKGE